MREGDNLVLPVPLFHCFGCVMGVLASMTNGATIILPSPSFEPKRVLESISKHKANFVYGVPTIFQEILKEYNKNSSLYDISRLRFHSTNPLFFLLNRLFLWKKKRGGIAAGSLVPSHLMHELINTLNLKDLLIGKFHFCLLSPSFQIHSNSILIHSNSLKLHSKFIQIHSNFIPTLYQPYSNFILIHSIF